MTLAEMFAAQTVLNRTITALLLITLAPLRVFGITPRLWLLAMRSVWPAVEAARTASAENARRYYDTERAKHLPDEPRHDVDLDNYTFDWFVEDMEPARVLMSKPKSSQADLAKSVMYAVKQVENGGRQTVKTATYKDKKAKGWARVQGGEDSCAFCLTMISRGPVYDKAYQAGFKGTIADSDRLWDLVENAKTADEKEDAQKAWNKLMTKWHPNCDCKVVPVFNKANYPGKEQADAALQLWKDVTKGHRGMDAINELRRYLEGRRPRRLDSVPIAA